MRTPKLPWEKLKDELIDLKYGQGMSLTKINAYLYEKYGKAVTNARLSQIYTSWKQAPGIGLVEEQLNAN